MWSITASQCCVRFCWTKWTSYLCTYISSLMNLPLHPHPPQRRELETTHRLKHLVKDSLGKEWKWNLSCHGLLKGSLSCSQWTFLLFQSLNSAKHDRFHHSMHCHRRAQNHICVFKNLKFWMMTTRLKKCLKLANARQVKMQLVRKPPVWDPGVGLGWWCRAWEHQCPEVEDP